MRAFFDLWSRVYDIPAVQRAVYKPVQDAVMGALGDPRDVLDLGCGTGLLTARIAEERPGARVVGCDFSAGMLGQAAARTSAAVFVQGDAMHLPVRDASVDVVTCTESFHWYPDQERALAEMRRVLRPGGRLLVALVNPRTAVVSDVAGRWSRLAGQPFHWPTRRRMRELAEAAGLVVERQDRVRRVPGIVLLPPALTIARRP